MRIAFLTPLPPAKTGIAVYASYLLPALAARADVRAVVDQPEWEEPEGCSVIPRSDYQPGQFDAVIYQLGNNPFHEWIYREAMSHPGIVDLHDVVLHHLIVEMTLARGDGEAYAEILLENHGPAGEAWARGRIAGYHDEIGNFLFPASVALAERAAQVIVHNRYGADVLRRAGVRTPITVLDMPFPAPRAVPLVPHQGTVIGMFGFVTDAKRPHAVFAAFAEARRRDPALRLLVVGEPAPNLDLHQLAMLHGLPEDSWAATGYVAEEEFDRYLASVDRVVNLRYPTAGETSGALLRIIHARKQVAVSDYGPFTEIPENVAARIPLGAGEHEALVEFMLFGSAHDPDMQRRWVESRSDLRAAVDIYLNVAAGVPASSTESPQPAGAIPLFPKMEVADALQEGGVLQFRIRNVGSGTVISEQFGPPGYRLLVKLFRAGREVFDAWVTPAGDLGRDQESLVRLRPGVQGDEIRLYHALQDVPDIDREPFAVVRVGEE